MTSHETVCLLNSGPEPAHVSLVLYFSDRLSAAGLVEVPAPVIAQAVMQLLVSRDHRKAWARSVALMREGSAATPSGRRPRPRASARPAAWLFPELGRARDEQNRLLVDAFRSCSVVAAWARLARPAA